MKKVGIFGGTFDPPHIGHLLIAEHVKESLDLDEIWFIPTNEPPHKAEATSETSDRLHMLKLAISENDAFHVNTIEVERKGKSFTIDTMKKLKETHDKIEFYFIIGADMVEYLPKWVAIDELIKLVTFVGVKRFGYDLQTFYPIKTVDVPFIDVSSSYIRERISERKTVKYLLHEHVLAYIKEHQLYEGK